MPLARCMEKELWDGRAGEYYSAPKRNKLPSHDEKTRRNLKRIRPRKANPPIPALRNQGAGTQTGGLGRVDRRGAGTWRANHADTAVAETRRTSVRTHTSAGLPLITDQHRLGTPGTSDGARGCSQQREGRVGRWESSTF